MRVERTLVGLLLLATAAATGCGRLAYNLPPASRLMEPGPGVGGPGPGVIPPAGSPYGIYGGAVGRYGGGMGGGMMMGGYGSQCATAPQQGPSGFRQPGAPSGVMQASFNESCDMSGTCSEGCSCDGPCGDSCPCGCAGGGPCNCGPGGCVQAGCFGGGLRGGLGHGMHGGCMRPGAMEASADGGGYMGMTASQIAFLGDDGVQVSWDVSGSGMFDSSPLIIPGRQDFYQGAIYRLKLTNIPGRAGVTLYPTLEVAPVTPRTDAYLAHSPIPVQFTEEDFDQVVSGNFVTKVIYLPDPEFQELALAGVETLVSTRLDPGVDPIAEADRRGSILAIVRMGNKDLELTAGETMERGVIPAGLRESSRRSPKVTSRETQASFEEQANVVTQPGGNMAAQYSDECPTGDCGPSFDGESYGDGGCYGDSGCYGDGGSYAGGGYCDGSMGNMPMGMPTSGFGPANVPPNMIAGAPQWGMPITGTPIGLPGPPHIPLGVPAGLQKHVMKNRTRVMVPPPVSKMHLSVKQRPGLNYPRPVNHATVDETQREPLRLLPGWLSGVFNHHDASAQCAPYPQ